MPRMEITTRIGCTNRCSYCPQDVLIGAYKKISSITMMNLTVFTRCIDRLPREVIISFSGFCEPWLNPWCTEMVLYAHRKGHTIMVYTTLVGMTEKDIDLLKLIPYRLFRVHIFDPTNDRRVGLMDKIRNDIPNAVFLHYADDVDKAHPAVRPFMKEKWKLSTRAGNIEIGGKEAKKKDGPIICLRSLRCNVLLPNGDVVICCNDYGLKHILGNLLVSDYNSLFEGEEHKKLVRGLSDDSVDTICRYCDNFAR
jgi:hypothetical protein